MLFACLRKKQRKTVSVHIHDTCMQLCSCIPEIRVRLNGSAVQDRTGYMGYRTCIAVFCYYCFTSQSLVIPETTSNKLYLTCMES